MTIKNITVIGAGTMGNGIAHVFAQNGFSINLVDVSQNQLDKALSTIQKNLNRQVAKNIITEEIKNNTIQNISAVTSVKEGVEKSDLVVEAATEDLDLKLKIFKEMDAFAQADCILATNTSSISITKIASRPPLRTHRWDKH